jgi:hypothetical protein
MIRGMLAAMLRVKSIIHGGIILEIRYNPQVLCRNPKKFIMELVLQHQNLV